MQQIKCCICGERIPVIEGNNPYPVRKWSALGSDKNRCCHSCNSDFVVPFRIAISSDSNNNVEQIHNLLMSYSYKELIELKKMLFQQ
jgi:hypothetical protein